MAKLGFWGTSELDARWCDVDKDILVLGTSLVDLRKRPWEITRPAIRPWDYSGRGFFVTRQSPEKIYILRAKRFPVVFKLRLPGLNLIASRGGGVGNSDKTIQTPSSGRNSLLSFLPFLQDRVSIFREHPTIQINRSLARCKSFDYFRYLCLLSG